MITYWGKRGTRLKSAAILSGLALYAFAVSFFVVVFKAGAVLLVLPLLLAVIAKSKLSFRAPAQLMRTLVYLYFALLLFWPRYIAFDISGPDVTPVRLVLLALLVLWLFSFASEEFAYDSAKALLKFPVVTAAWIMLVLVKTASAFASEAVGVSIYLWGNELLSVLLFYPVIVTLFCSDKNGDARQAGYIDAWLKLVFWVAVALATIALIEQGVKRPLFSGVVLPGMNIDTKAFANAISEKIRDGVYRSQATFSHPLVFAQFLFLSLPLTLYLSASARSFKLSFLFALGAATQLLALDSTASRAAALGTVVLVLVGAAGFLLRRFVLSGYRRVAIPMFFAALGGAIVAGLALAFGDDVSAYVFGRSSLESQSTGARLLMLERALKAVSDDWLIGRGQGLAPYFIGVRGTGGAVTVDSYYLSLLVEAGALAIFLYAAFFLSAAAKVFSYNALRSPHGGVLIALVTALLSTLFFLSILSITELHALLALNVGLILMVSGLKGVEPDNDKEVSS